MNTQSQAKRLTNAAELERRIQFLERKLIHARKAARRRLLHTLAEAYAELKYAS